MTWIYGILVFVDFLDLNLMVEIVRHAGSAINYFQSSRLP